LWSIVVKIVSVGGGPAGLYLSILLKQRDRHCEISVFERNAEGHTEGWGIVFWDDLLQQMRDCDPVSASKILANSRRWTDQVLNFDGKTTTYRGGTGYSICRRRFLDILAARAKELGVDLHYQSDVANLDAFAAADVIVASDGAGSKIREHASGEFGTQIRHGRNKYIWLGTSKVLDAFTFAIVTTDAGRIWFHGYPYSSDMSTCVVECSPETWSGLGFDSLDMESALVLLESIFAEVLEGQRLMSGGSAWHSFRAISNQTWRLGKAVLMGDAAHTTHFSIGSGTKLALEDAIALSRNLRLFDGVEDALETYERERKQALHRTLTDAHFSATWFENIERYLGLPDREILLLLLLRRSPLLARIPPGLYRWLHEAAENVPALKVLRTWIVPRARAAYSLWWS
jgi:2-polyprenyl-6-methoxyphenol hydroxylase-like FAD-dependent oxidoreductase